MQIVSAENAPRVLQSPAHAPLITHLLECSFSDFSDNGIAIVPHLHHFHQLDVILEGVVRIGLNQKTALQAQRGQAILLPPLCRHSYNADNKFRHASFKFHMAPKCWAIFGDAPLHVKLPAHLLINLEDARASRLARKELHQEQAVASATLCMMALLQEIPNSDARNSQSDYSLPNLWELLEEIENAPFNNWSVAILARRCHLSPDHFSRCFSQLLQRTPQRYLIETRMKSSAALLLREPLRPIKLIAEECGYASVHAFSRAFKSVFGCGPAAYRHAPHNF
jgi:AraC-like DNA-binding protein